MPLVLLNNSLLINEKKDSLNVMSLSFFTDCKPASFELNNLAWSPYKETPLLHPISIAVNPAEFIAVVGPNGSGKTSLLRCLYRVNKPSSGQVLMGSHMRSAYCNGITRHWCRVWFKCI